MIPVKSFSLRLFLLSMFLLPLAGFAQVQPPETQKLVHTLATQWAIRQQLQEIPDDIRAEFAQNPLRISDEKNKKLLHLFDQSFTPALLFHDFEKALQQNITHQQTGDITAWLQTANSKSIAGAEQEYYTLQGKRKRVITMYDMDQQPPSRQRKTLIQSIADTTSAPEQLVESSAIIVRSIIKALNKMSAKRNLSDTQIDAIVQNIKAQVQTKANQEINHKLMIKYYNLKLATLRSYLGFAQSNAGLRLHDAINQSMQAAYEAAGQHFLRAAGSH